MVGLKLSEPTFLSTVVEEYFAEIIDFTRLIHEAALEAGFPPEDFVPPVVREEHERAEGCRRIVAIAASNALARAAGLEVAEDHASLFHAALLLTRDRLTRRLRAVRAAPLSPPQACRPLEERIQRIDTEIARLWREFPVSSAFELVATRVALREGGLGWQSLVQWLREQPKPLERWWCFCDTNFFLESRSLFSQVDWHTVWGLPRVVLVVPQAMLRELDDFKADPRKERSRRRQRASKVLEVLESTAEAAAPGIPALLRPGVELLVLDHEPFPEMATLDPRLADDRLVGAAMDFHEHLPDERVVLVSDDRGPRFKARRYSLERRALATQRRSIADVEATEPTRGRVRRL